MTLSCTQGACFSSSTQEMWKLHRRDEVSGRDQGCAENCRHPTRAMRSTDDPDEDSQQGPEHTDARPRADSSAVARCNDADLEPASLGESCKKRTRELHRGKPADGEVQSQVNKDGRTQQKDCAQQQVKRKPHSADDTYRRGKRRRIRIQQKDEIAQFQKCGSLPRADAREKLLEQDAQSHLTAVRKTLRSR